MKNKLAYHNGFLCVAIESLDNDRPALSTSFYPIAKMAQSEVEHWNYPIDAALREWTNGVFETMGTSYTQTFRLMNYGATLPIDVVETPIAAPRAKKLRWECGRWQKWSERKGWVST